jgi:hypothetical protein
MGFKETVSTLQAIITIIAVVVEVGITEVNQFS